MKKRHTTMAALAGLCGLALAQDKTEADHYPMAEIPIPDGVVLEVGAVEMLPGDVVAVASRRGDVYLVENAFDENPANTKWTLYASGLHEVLGLAWVDGWLQCTQRPEVTRMKDEDGDGRADVFETLGDGWQINGDYHEYAFGSRPDRNGDTWVVLCLTGSGGASSNFRGWCLRVTKDGRTIPTCSGVRSPGGIGANHLGDMFYTDNQGPWNGSSALKWLKPGGFVGNPTGNKYYELTDAIGPRPADPKSGGDSRIHTERERIPELVPPACVLPHGKLGQSPSGVACDTTGGKFGPFENQLFVGEQTWSQVQRVYLEKVKGVYQGACFPFRSGFGSGCVGLRFAPDGSLFVGGTSRGWGSRGKKSFAFERLRWNGETPFEIKEMKARPDGFELVFTRPADPATLTPASFTLEAWTYVYQSGYGSPEVDRVAPKVVDVTAAPDGGGATLKVEGLAKGHVHWLKSPGVKSDKGEPLLHSDAWYTLNEIP